MDYLLNESIRVLIPGRCFFLFPFFLSYQLVEQDSEGQCNSECKTIEQACQEVWHSSYLILNVFVFPIHLEMERERQRERERGIIVVNIMFLIFSID